MAKLTKKEKAKIELQMGMPVDRGDTWTGFRPIVFKEGKYNKKETRRQGKMICKGMVSY